MSKSTPYQKSGSKDVSKKQKKVVISETEMLSTHTPERVMSLPLKSALKKGKAVKEAQNTEKVEVAVASAAEEEVFLNGFEEEEEQDDSSDDEDEELKQTSEFASKDLPSAPGRKPTSDQSKRKTAEETGVVYLGRIPHGFHEDEMKSYFGQFGEVVRLRLSRNRRTGRSKHYGFIEFKHREVAQIVAETLNNYLLCGNMLQCKLLEKDEVHPRMWIGSGKKFRKDWKIRLLREKHNQEKTLAQQTAISNRLIQREALKRKRFAELGIDYDFPGYCNPPSSKESAEPIKKAKTKGTVNANDSGDVVSKTQKHVRVGSRPKRKST